MHQDDDLEPLWTLFERWLREDEAGQALLGRLRADPDAGRRALRERLLHNPPPELRTYLHDDAKVDRLLNVNQVANLYVDEGGGGRKVLHLYPQRGSLQLEVDEPQSFSVRVHNDDTSDQLVDLYVRGPFREYATVTSARLHIPAGGDVDARVELFVPRGDASRLLPAVHQLELVARLAADLRVQAQRTVRVHVKPFQWVEASLQPAMMDMPTWRRYRVPRQVVVFNRGNEHVDVNLSLHLDPRLAGRLRPERLAVPHEGSAAARVDVLPRSLTLLWPRTLQFAVAVRAERSGHQVTGRLRQPPVLKPGAIGILAILVLATIGFLLSPLDWSGGPLDAGGRAFTTADQTVPTAPSTTRARRAAKPATPTATRADPPATTVAEQACLEGGTTTTGVDQGYPCGDIIGGGGDAGTVAPVRPAAVVREFYESVNAREYDRAWSLTNFGGLTEREFLDGYKNTDLMIITITKVQGPRVDVRIEADENNFRQHTTYDAYYIVRDGKIVEGHMKRVVRRQNG